MGLTSPWGTTLCRIRVDGGEGRNTTRKRIPNRNRETRLASVHTQRYAHRCVCIPLLVSIYSRLRISNSKDRRWVVNDYYEDKVLADITEKGLKPGDLVDELADPNAPSATALPAAETANAQKADRAGELTLFGGLGWALTAMAR